nr:MAG TPA: hypothetical protein [Caudoviricetes sp.]
MKLIPTFIDNHFCGYSTKKDLYITKNKFYAYAAKQQKVLKADHMIYCHYDVDDDGEIKTAWFYNSLAMKDIEFEHVANLKNAYIGAIHKF